jgi:hypothetical protein
MTIEIHNPELESLLQQRLRSGNFSNLEDMLLETFREARTDASLEEEKKQQALAAAVRIRELRKGVTLERPEGMSLREYAHIGHKY